MGCGASTDASSPPTASGHTSSNRYQPSQDQLEYDESAWEETSPSIQHDMPTLSENSFGSGAGCQVDENTYVNADGESVPPPLTAVGQATLELEMLRTELTRAPSMGHITKEPSEIAESVASSFRTTVAKLHSMTFDIDPEERDAIPPANHVYKIKKRVAQWEASCTPPTSPSCSQRGSFSGKSVDAVSIASGASNSSHQRHFPERHRSQHSC